MSINFSSNYFELFNLPVKFRLDSNQMSEAWRNIQNMVHPDRHVQGSAQDKRIAMQWAVYVNEAFTTLRNPLDRARYLLALHGFDTKEETDTFMPEGFLMEQMIWRENIEEAISSNNINELNSLLQQLYELYSAGEDRLGQFIDDKQNYIDAILEVRKLRFFQRLEKEIKDSVEQLE
ncbi:MAG: Fe-S protein assembly co-chaperone HscB [Proteobacteria bacterium]|nr:Fe-S protein assembly co-chaperone HscB [Pseudomonadota bacterium]MDE3207830.1 Fe-S protein assembly co-chaperone HscB [Pseudomonadota bacterium]